MKCKEKEKSSFATRSVQKLYEFLRKWILFYAVLLVQEAFSIYMCVILSFCKLGKAEFGFYPDISPYGQARSLCCCFFHRAELHIVLDVSFYLLYLYYCSLFY